MAITVTILIMWGKRTDRRQGEELKWWAMEIMQIESTHACSRVQITRKNQPTAKTRQISTSGNTPCNLFFAHHRAD